VASREALMAQVREATQRFATGEVPRPSFWGGYRLWAEAVELWVEGDARIHDRARWTRSLQRSPDGSIQPGPWSVTRLQP
jgi:pyridoxamine 5'-phosphate oxidase